MERKDEITMEVPRADSRSTTEQTRNNNQPAVPPSFDKDPMWNKLRMLRPLWAWLEAGAGSLWHYLVNSPTSLDSDFVEKRQQAVLNGLLLALSLASLLSIWGLYYLSQKPIYATYNGLAQFVVTFGLLLYHRVTGKKRLVVALFSSSMNIGVFARCYFEGIFATPSSYMWVTTVPVSLFVMIGIRTGAMALLAVVLQTCALFFTQPDFAEPSEFQKRWFPQSGSLCTAERIYYIIYMCCIVMAAHLWHHAALEHHDLVTALKRRALTHLGHELRAPLNSIVLLVDELQTQNNDAECPLKHPIENHAAIDIYDALCDAAAHMLSLINSLLAFESIETGNFALQYKEFCVCNTANKVVKVLSSQAKNKHISLQVDDTGLQHSRRIGDPIRLSQILYNLIGNAIKFTPEQGKIDLTLQDDGEGELRVRVSDTGPGISPEKLPKLFSSFYQVSPDSCGTGLGLSISKKLIDCMHGHIGVCNRPDRQTGTVFWFTIPFESTTGGCSPTCSAHRSSHTVPSVPTPSLPRKPNSDIKKDSHPASPLAVDVSQGYHSSRTLNELLTGLRVLIVDDNQMNRHLLTGCLHRAQCEIVDEASSGSECIMKVFALSNYYHAVVLDCIMPDITGFEVARRIRVVDTKVTLVGLTGLADKASLHDCLTAGMNVALQKPVQLPELRRALRSALPSEAGCACRDGHA